MKKSYKVKVNQTADKSEVVNVSADKAQATKIPAVAGARYQLIDNNTGLAPDNIRAKRIGKDLGVIFEGRSEPDLLITDYYENTATGFNALIGEAESGAFHAYIPESANGATSIGVMADGSAQVGMALGGEQIAASGAAVGTLVAAAGFSPLWALPLALLGAGGGGGSDAAAPVATGPKVSASKLHQEDDTGVSNTDNITADNTPRIVVDADAGATVTVKINGKEYAGKEVSPGRYEIPVTEALPDGLKTFDVVAKNAAGGTTTFKGTEFVVDTSSANNYVAPDQTKPTTDPNNGIAVTIKLITTDTGSSANDFYTSDNTLDFAGTVGSFTNNGDMVEVHLLDSSGKVLASEYVLPDSGKWNWKLTTSMPTLVLADGKYAITAQVVDKAGNPVSPSPAAQIVFVDTDGFKNQPDETDPNAKTNTSIKIGSIDDGRTDTTAATGSKDTGVDQNDFVTSDNTLVFQGQTNNFDASKGGMVHLQVINSNNEAVVDQYLSPMSDKWSFDNQGKVLSDGKYTIKSDIVDKAGNTVTFSGLSKTDTHTLVIKSSVDPSNPNKTATIDIDSISVDSGVSRSDFITNDSTLTYSGKVAGFTANGDKVKVELLLLKANVTTVIATAYVDVTATKGGAGTWTWAYEKKQDDGQYSVRATIVDALDYRVNENAVGQDTQIVIVDTSGSKNQPDETTDPNAGASITIGSIHDGLAGTTAANGSKDTGPLQTDFVTSDNTLVFQGQTSNFDASKDGRVHLQVINSSSTVVVDQYLSPGINGKWSFDNQGKVLSDGVYTIKSDIVDKAGNTVTDKSNHEITAQQSLTINTGSGVDPKNLEIGITSLGNGQDSGNSNSDFLTNVQKLSFKGSFSNQSVVSNDDAKILVQVIDTSGKILSMSYQDLASNGQWVFNNESNTLGGVGSNTQYLLKASIVDLAGNILKTTDQSFVVDLKKPSFTPSGENSIDTTFGDVTYKNISIYAGEGVNHFGAENGTFYFTNGADVKIDGPKRGISSEFNVNDFVIHFKDLAGNESVYKNPAKWIFKLDSQIEYVVPTYVSPSTFGGTELADSIGEYVLAANDLVYDLARLHVDTPHVGDLAVHNHIGLSGLGNQGDFQYIKNVDHVLNLTTSDVLSMGVKNSFVSDGYMQLRIDGDDGDTVNLDNLLGSTQYDWVDHSVDKTIGNQSYHVYTNDALNLEVLVQQPIHIYLV